MEHVKSTIDKIVAAYDARAAEAQTCLNCEWAVASEEDRLTCRWWKTHAVPAVMIVNTGNRIDRRNPMRYCPCWQELAAVDRAQRESGGAA